MDISGPMFKIISLLAIGWLVSSCLLAVAADGQTASRDPWQVLDDAMAKQVTVRGGARGVKMMKFLKHTFNLKKQPELKEALEKLKALYLAVERKECSHGASYTRKCLHKIVRRKYANLELVVRAYSETMAETCSKDHARNFRERKRVMEEHYPVDSREMNSLTTIKGFFNRLIYARLADQVLDKSKDIQSATGKIDYEAIVLRWTENSQYLSKIFRTFVLRPFPFDTKVAASIAYDELSDIAAKRDFGKTEAPSVVPSIDSRSADKLYWSVLVDSCNTFMRLYGDSFDLANEDAKYSQTPYLDRDLPELSEFYLAWSYYKGCQRMINDPPVSHGLQRAIKEVANSKLKLNLKIF